MLVLLALLVGLPVPTHGWIGGGLHLTVQLEARDSAVGAPSLGGLVLLSQSGPAGALASSGPPAQGFRAEVVSSPAEPQRDVWLTQVAQAPAQPSRSVVLNFDNADIEVVIRAASEIVGFNYVLAPDVSGKVTVQTSSRILREEVFNVLLAILEVHGFTAIRSDAIYKILKFESAAERAVPTIVGAAPDPARGSDEIITQIVPIRFASIPDLSALLRPLISARGRLTSYRETNLLMITDAAANIRRLLEIVQLVDVEVARGELEVVPLRFADAAELANVLNQLFAPGRFRPSAPPAVPAPPPPRRPSARPPAPPSPAEAPGPERAPFIAAYRGMNALVIRARKAEMELIRRLVSQLDVDLYAGRQVFIYLPENVKARDLAATLNAIYGRAGGPPSAPRQPTVPAPPLPLAPPPPSRRGPPASSEAPAPGPPEGKLHFVPDETTNALIVTLSRRDGPEREQAQREARPGHPESSDARASRLPGGSASRLHRGFVIIDANPPDAQVFLDGQLVGMARQLVARAFRVPVGNHTVEIVSVGFRPQVARFSVSPSFPTRIRVALDPE